MRYFFGEYIEQGLKKYCETAFSRSGINQMLILKNSKELLEHLKSPNFNLITSIKSFEYSILYTTIPHQKLKSRLATIIKTPPFMIGDRRYKYLILGREGPYFVKEHTLMRNTITLKKTSSRFSGFSSQYFRCLRWRGFPTDNRHSHRHKLCPSPSRHMSVLLRSGIHTVLALGQK